MAAPPKLVHIVLMTNRLPEMRDWYASVLGAHVVYENPGLCFMTFDEEHHRLALVAPPVQLTERTPLTAGMHHSAYTFASLDDLLACYAKLKAIGIEPRTPIQHGVDFAVLPRSRWQQRRTADRQLRERERSHGLHDGPGLCRGSDRSGLRSATDDRGAPCRHPGGSVDDTRMGAGWPGAAGSDVAPDESLIALSAPAVAGPLRGVCRCPCLKCLS